jgi:hypothetical protein
MKSTLLAAAVLCVAVLSGCQKPEEKSAEPKGAAETTEALEPVYVTISIDPATNKPKADPDPVPIKPNQQVVWQTSPADKEFVVFFKTDTPFQDRYFNNNSKKSGKSKVTVPPGQEKKFSYGIMFDGKETDPEVIIKPGK